MTADPKAFLGDFLLDYSEGDHLDIDGAAIQDLLLEHGLMYKCVATEADCDEEWAKDWDYEPGDEMMKYGPVMLDLMKQARVRTAEKRKKLCPKTS